jgi:predicted NBD/HSP70 family sugar kinase
MQVKADSELVRRQNRSIVLRALRALGPMARIELGRSTGLSPASITSISSQLIAENIVEELAMVPPPEARRGRPIVRLGLKSSVAHVLAVAIAIDAVKLALADFSGRVIHEATLHIATFETDGTVFAQQVGDSITDFFRSIGFDQRSLARIGVALQGVADMRDGTLVWSPAFRARNIILAAPLQARFGVPCLVANDANMIAEGLVTPNGQPTLGATVCIFTGYGVGAGLIINGSVYHGATGAAAEFGHMNHIPHGAPCRCGKRGCIEAYAADYGIVQNARGDAVADASHSAIASDTMLDLLRRAQGDDRQARAAFDKAGEALGFGIARLVAILNPERIVLAGPGLGARQLLEPALNAALEAGLVDDLRQNIQIEFIAFDEDMIFKGTIAALLRLVDGVMTAAQTSLQEP